MFQGHSNVKLQLAATFCISNLIWNEEDGEKCMTRGFRGGQFDLYSKFVQI